MDDRKNIIALLRSGRHDHIPIWLMGFDDDETARRLLPDVELPLNLSHHPAIEDYPWSALGQEERNRTLAFNRSVLKPSTGIGWGANMSLGHGGPGEFHYHIIESSSDERVLQCETGVRRMIKTSPPYYRDFDFPITKPSELTELRLPDPHDQERYHGFADDVRFFRDAGYFIYANVNGFFSAVHYFLMDYQEFLTALAIETANIKRLIDMLGEWNLAAAEEMLTRGVDCIVTCDDLGFVDNMLISPAMYEELIYPWHRKLCVLAHDHGAWCHLHCHGNINKIIPLIVEAGFDMLNPFDLYESMDLTAFLQKYGENGPVPVGGLHKFFFQWDRTVQQEYLEALFRKANDAGGRWMFMDTGGIPADMDIGTFRFMMDLLVKLRNR